MLKVKQVVNEQENHPHKHTLLQTAWTATQAKVCKTVCFLPTQEQKTKNIPALSNTKTRRYNQSLNLTLQPLTRKSLQITRWNRK